MALFFEIYRVDTAIAIHEQFLELLATLIAIDREAAALRIPSPVSAVLPRARAAYADFNSGLNRVAGETAKEFDVAARARLADTSQRDDTRTAPHLRNLIESRPVTFGFADTPTGAVGLARVSTLERARNPRTPGYGTYWRAQEYGTGGEGGVPSQVGRKLYGFFYRPGLQDPQRPQAQYAGAGDPGYPIFLPGRPDKLPSSVRGGIGLRGGRGGIGEIHHEIRARRFLRDSVEVTYRTWLAGVEATETQALRDLSAL